MFGFFTRRYVGRQLDEVQHILLTAIKHQGDRMTQTVEDVAAALSAKLDANDNAVALIAAEVSASAAEFAKLADAIRALGKGTPPNLDAILALASRVDNETVSLQNAAAVLHIASAAADAVVTPSEPAPVEDPAPEVPAPVTSADADSPAPEAPVVETPAADAPSA